MASISPSLSHVEKEMGYSQQEFIRQFRIFARQLDYDISNNEIIINEHNHCLKIRFQEKAKRILSSLTISRLLVTLSFENYTQEQQIKFLKQFDLSFQRGGG